MKTKPIPAPAGPLSTPPDAVASGLPVLPIERIKIFSSTEWEEFILEWVDSLYADYSKVERCGGSGDMGCDIVAICKHDTGQWDSYQCKHYRDPLTPTDIWIEIGKLVYYTHLGEYTYPRHYYFVAQQGAGTTLLNLLKKPDKLRSEFLANWDRYCRGSITKTAKVDLNKSLRKHIAGLDFSVFEALSTLRIIDAHMKTRWHVARFGGGLPARPQTPLPPRTPAASEAVYLRQLLNAYSDHLRRPLTGIPDIASEPKLSAHLSDSRREFYSAESLRSFSRDTLPPGEFDKLQEEVHSGIGDEIRATHADGYQRVLSVVRAAQTLQITAHALISRLTVRDRGGICHQLANDGKVRWV